MGDTVMTATHFNTYTDCELEAKAQSVLTDLGIDMSTAINGFLTQVVHEKSIPFEIDKSKMTSGKQPRSELMGCMEIWMSDDFDAPLEEMKEYME